MFGKLIIFVRRAIYIFLGVLSDLTHQNSPEVIILCYHSISRGTWRYGTSLEDFKSQMNYLEKKYKFISFSQLEEYLDGKPVTSPSVLITFDDGYKDIYSAKDFLKEKGIKPIMFLIADRGVEIKTEKGKLKTFLSTKEVKSLVTDGWTLGSHTLTHPDLTNISERELERQLKTSKENLEKEHGVKVKLLAYPMGLYTSKVINVARKNGYEGGFSMDGTSVEKGTDRFSVPRIGIDRTISLLEFKQMIKPLAGKMRLFLRRSGLIGHLNYE